jgi:hypothetical protein
MGMPRWQGQKSVRIFKKTDFSKAAVIKNNKTGYFGD